MISIIKKSINFLFFAIWGYMSLFSTFKTFDFFLWFCFCDAPKSNGPLISRQPIECMWISCNSMTPQNLGVPLTTHQPTEFLWISSNPIPHCCVPFIGIHIFTKNWAKSLLFEELYPIYNLYNSISMTHPGSQRK